MKIKKAFPLSGKPSISKLILLFPFTYLIHVAEEFWCGERFFYWLNRVAQVQMTAHSFLCLNAIFMSIMIIAVAVALWRRNHYIPLVLATVVATNSLLHLVGTIVTKSYSPGIISALTFWLPLAIWTFYHESQFVRSRGKVIAIAVGICAHIVISYLALR